MFFSKRSWASIDLDALKENASYIQKKLGDAQMIGTVKADGYGHGAVYTAKTLSHLGVNWFSVSNINEAIELREGGIDGSILILGYTPTQAAPELCKYGITQAVFSVSYARELSEALGEKKLPVHIKLDTGMGRLGISCEPIDEALENLRAIYELKNLKVDGVFSHLCHADSLEKSAAEFTKRQERLFREVTSKMEEEGLCCGKRHLQNSAAILRGVGTGFELARPGVILYGLNPSNEVVDPNLKPVLSLKTVVSMVKWMPEGRPIGYGRTFYTGKKTKVATVPIGYADGYSRLLSNKGTAIVNGKVVPVIGTICMDQMMLDVTPVQVKAGDEVTLIGKVGEEEITASDLAEKIGTINYEIVCMISKRIPRVYWENGKKVGTMQMV